jgi:hypothetical protein
LQSLETLLGARLILRTTHAMKLTDDGERCYQPDLYALVSSFIFCLYVLRITVLPLPYLPRQSASGGFALGGGSADEYDSGDRQPTFAVAGDVTWREAYTLLFLHLYFAYTCYV